MANKSNLSTILGVAGATVIAAGGSAFVTNTAMDAVSRQATVQESETVIPERETEEPLTIETFASTRDAFTVKPVSETENNKDDSDNNDTETESTSTENGTSGNAEGGSSDGSGDGAYYGSENNDGSYASDAGSGSYTSSDGSYDGSYDSSTGSSYSAGNSGTGVVTYTGNGGDVAYFDEWGGWIATNGDYYDGQGGYYDENGYHYVGDSISTPSGAASYTPSSNNSGSSNAGSDSSSGNSGSSTAWDDSYIFYDTAVRYIDASEISNWSANELAIARNEIFARHGRIFVLPEWSSYFAQKTWYTPKYENVDHLLNDYEWANLEVILKMEEKFY